MRGRTHLLCLVTSFPFIVSASLPRVPFSGYFGGTVGAGAVVGWERQGLGVNPAVSDPQSMGVSLAGYSPFGIDEVKIAEAGAAWDGARWGTSLTYLGLYDAEGGSASAWQLQESVRLGWGMATGLSVKFQDDESGRGFGGSLGMLWNRFSFLTLGGIAETSPMPWGTELAAGLGMDAGGDIGRDYAWRLCAEDFYSSAQEPEWRFGAALRLHSLLSIHGGWSPRTQTFALGLRFGIGGWKGFSALRRHAALGTTSIQGLHWRRALPP
jgi:hypothetical protein